MPRRLLLASLMVCLLVSCAGSTSLYQIRGTEKPWEPPKNFTVETLERDRYAQLNLEARSVEKFRDFQIGVIEITDDGLVNPAQMEQVFEMVRPRLESRNALLIVFVHGWHHGPHVCDRDLCCFRRVMEKIATSEDLKNRNVEVTGVYIGWRGESLRKPLSALTLWDRKATAQHIGRTGAKEVLLQLDAMYAKAKEANRDRYMTMVTVGHSLGGALVYSAMKGIATGDAAGIVEGSRQDRTYRVVRAEGDRVAAAGRKVKATRARLGDLAVLVNPAIEASEYRPFHADLPHTAAGNYRPPPDKEWPYDEHQLPVLMAVASEADQAVGKLFVAGRWVSAVRHPKIAFDASRRIGIGHYQDHVTHRLEYPKKDFAEEKQQQCECPKDFNSEHMDISGAPLVLTTRDDQDFGQLTFRLDPRHKASWDVHSPYLVVSTSPGVMREHSDIYNPVFVEFLTKFIRAYYARSVEVQNRAAGR